MVSEHCGRVWRKFIAELGVILVILSPQCKTFHPTGRYGARAGAGGGSGLHRGEWKKRNFPWDVGLAAAAAGFGFRAEQSRGRCMLRTYAVSEAAAAAAAESCEVAAGSTDLVVR